MKSIERYRENVIFIGTVVAAQIIDDNSLGPFPVKTEYPHIEVFLIVEESDFGSLRRRLPGFGLSLGKVGGRRG